VKEERTLEEEGIRIVVVIIGIVRWIGIAVIIRVVIIVIIVRRPGVIVVRRLDISIVLFRIGNGRGLPIAHRAPHVTIAVAASEEKKCGEKAHAQKPFSYHCIHLPSLKTLRKTDGVPH